MGLLISRIMGKFKKDARIVVSGGGVLGRCLVVSSDHCHSGSTLPLHDPPVRSVHTPFHFTSLHFTASTEIIHSIIVVAHALTRHVHRAETKMPIVTI